MINKGLTIATAIQLQLQPWTKTQMEKLLAHFDISEEQLGRDIHALVRMGLLQEVRFVVGPWLYKATTELLGMDPEEVVRRCREFHS